MSLSSRSGGNVSIVGFGGGGGAFGSRGGTPAQPVAQFAERHRNSSIVMSQARQMPSSSTYWLRYMPPAKLLAEVREVPNCSSRARTCAERPSCETRITGCGFQWIAIELRIV